MTSPILSIKEVAHYIKTLVGLDPFLQSIWVSGEITNIRTHTKNNTCFFTLSDPNKENQLNAIMFTSQLDKKHYQPKNGEHVYAYGKIIYYNKRGQLTFQIQSLRRKGAGQHSQALYNLQKKLKSEGLFDLSLKKSLPQFPRKIAVITAKSSAAESDIHRIASTSLPSNCLTMIPAIVQGPESPSSLVKALQHLEKLPHCDAVIMARGGGSTEDLSSFNEETVVRAMSACTIPIITGIGHESDATLAEKVADVRASTPTHAITIACEGYNQFRKTLQPRLQTLQSSLHQTLAHQKNHLHQRLQQLQNQLKTLKENLKKDHQNRLHRITQCNPLLRLQQGYSITRLRDGTLIDPDRLKKSTLLKTQTATHIIQSKVDTITPLHH